MHRTENPAMSVRLRLLPHKDQIPNVGSGYSLQNYSNTGSIPVLISKKVLEKFGGMKRVVIFAPSKTVTKQQTMFTIRIIAMVGGTEKQSPGIPIV